MTKINLSVILAASLLLGGTVAAVAGPTCTPSATICNQTLVEGYQSGGGPNKFGGSYWSSTGIGQPIYNTPQATVTVSGDSVNIVFQTGLYLGEDKTYSGSPYNTTVYAADVFLNNLNAGGVVNNGGYLPGTHGNTFYNYGISLGLDTADGGEAAGLYALGTNAKDGTKASGGSYLTSQDIWKGRNTAFTYGGAYGTAACANPNDETCATSAAAPTVVTGGVKQTGVSVTTSCYDGLTLGPSDKITCDSGTGVPDGQQGLLEVTLTATGTGSTLATNLAFLQGLFQNYDLFWGTGDCSNAPIWGQVSQLNSAPEPSSLALFATAAMGWRMMRRRKRKAPATA